MRGPRYGAGEAQGEVDAAPADALEARLGPAPRRHRFASEYEKPLYRESQLLAPTTTAGMRNRVPLVFRFNTGGRGLFAKMVRMTSGAEASS